MSITLAAASLLTATAIAGGAVSREAAGHLGTRRGEPLLGMRYATLCAAIPVAQVTQAFVTTTLLFGGLVALLIAVQFLVAIAPWRH